MLKITLRNYPLGSTWSKIELVPEAQFPGPPNNFWVSEKPIPKSHTFDIDTSFYPLRVTLLMVLRDYELVYEFQGTNPDQPNYQNVIMGSPAHFVYDIATETWHPTLDWTRIIIAGIAVAGVVGVIAIAATRRS